MPSLGLIISAPKGVATSFVPPVNEWITVIVPPARGIVQTTPREFLPPCPATPNSESPTMIGGACGVDPFGPVNEARAVMTPVAVSAW